MTEVTASEFLKQFGQYRKQVQKEVIAVTSHGRITGYFLSEKEFREYMLLKELSRKAYHISELSNDTIASIAEAKMSSDHDHLNLLMD